MNIQNECMTLNLAMGTWMGYRLDKKVSKKIVDDAGASTDAGRFNKHLVSRDALNIVQGPYAAVRAHLYAKTLPWKDNGDRLLMRTKFEDFMHGHNQLVSDAEQAKRTFIDDAYPRARDQASFRMGELFDASDYPAPAAIERCFYIRLDIDKVSQALDFRLDDSEAQMQSRVNRAMYGLWEKVAEPLEKLSAALERDKVLRASLIENLKAIVDVAPSLNFTNDPELDRFCESIGQKLLVYEAVDLRGDKNEDVRKVVAAEAKAIFEGMAGFMNAFGGQK